MSTPLSIVPEWYLRAPFNYVFSSSPFHEVTCTVVNCTLYFMRSVRSKAINPSGSGNGQARSGWLSGLRNPSSCKNSPVAKSCTANLNELDTSSRLPHDHLATTVSTRFPDSTIIAGVSLLLTTQGRACKRSVRMQEPTQDIYGKHKNLGWPTVRNGYGHGDSIVVNSGNSHYCKYTLSNVRYFGTLIKSTAKHEVSQLLDAKPSPFITDKGERTLIFAPIDLYKVIHVIGHPSTLQLAYELIKSNKGNMTPGATKDTLDGMSQAWFEKTSAKIIEGTYKWGTGRIVSIQKSSGGTRNLTVASPRDKVVQKAIELVLTEIYSGTTSKHSHGFIRNRGCHTALQEISQTFKGASWIIEADFSKYFDTIDHSKLRSTLAMTIKCDKTLALITRSLKAGTVSLKARVPTEFIKTSAYQRSLLPSPLRGGKDTSQREREVLIRNKVIPKTIGTPQGAIHSPILANIFLTQLDNLMESLIIKYNKGSWAKQNPAYSRILNLRATYIRRGTLTPDLNLKLRRQAREIPSQIRDSSFIRVNYVRYADDFVISVLGPYSLAQCIWTEIRGFIQKNIGLSLNESKTGIKSFKRGFSFLGTNISSRSHNISPVKLITKGPNAGLKSRITPLMNLHVPIRKLMERLVLRGYAKWLPGKTSAVGTCLTSIMNLEHRSILYIYNSVLRGIVNYYSFADNRSSLFSIVWIIKRSCHLTFAKKYKLRTMAKTFKSLGSNIECPSTGVHLWKPITLERIRKFNPSLKTLPKESIGRSGSNKLTNSTRGLSCIVCSTFTNVENHQIRAIREIRKNIAQGKGNWSINQMAAINRKQVPLCRTHHLQLHHNSMSAEDRLLLSQGCKTLVSQKASKTKVKRSRVWQVESRMNRKVQVRFGGGL
jgi:nicotine oxidoreductase